MGQDNIALCKCQGGSILIDGIRIKTLAYEAGHIKKRELDATSLWEKLK